MKKKPIKEYYMHKEWFFDCPRIPRLIGDLVGALVDKKQGGLAEKVVDYYTAWLPERVPREKAMKYVREIKEKCEKHGLEVKVRKGEPYWHCVVQVYE